MIELFSAEVFREIRTGNMFTDDYYIRRQGAVTGKISINKLFDVLKNNGTSFFIPDDIRNDLDNYGKFREKKKEIWINTDGKRNPRKIAELEKKFGHYPLIK